jgi:hypothetical protein
MFASRNKIGFGIATVIVLSIPAWFENVAVSQQRPGEQAANNDVTVCVGPDSIMRSPDAKTGFCPTGTEKLTLAGADLVKPDDDDDDALVPTPKPIQMKSDPLSDIEKRLSDLAASPLFEVVDDSGRVMFRVAPEKVQVYDNNRTAVAGILSSSDGGEFVARTADRKLSCFIGSYGDHAGFRMTEGGVPTFDLLRQEGGNYSLRIPMGDGLLAGVGESKAGTGALVVGDLHGRPRASLTLGDGRGGANIFNEGGNGISVLSQSAAGGGLLVLTNADSYVRVKFGNNDDRYGVVMAFPPGLPYVPKSGLPGSYMLGCAGGGACTP